MVGKLLPIEREIPVAAEIFKGEFCSDAFRGEQVFRKRHRVRRGAGQRAGADDSVRPIVLSGEDLRVGECHRDNRGRKRERRDVGQTARRLKIVREILLLIQALIIEGGIKLQLLRDIIEVILRRQAVFFVVHIPEDPAVDPVGIMRYVLVVVEVGDDLRNGVEGEDSHAAG